MIEKRSPNSLDTIVMSLNEFSEMRFEIILNILIEKGIVDYEEVIEFYGYVDDDGIRLKGDEMIEQIKKTDNRMLYYSIMGEEEDIEEILCDIDEKWRPKIKALFKRVKKMEDIINYLRLSLTAFGRLVREGD